MKRAIYIPGLGHEQLDISVKAYAQRMTKAIDEQNSNASNTYRIESSDREYDGSGNVADVVSIFEINQGNEIEIYRFFEFKYGSFLTHRYRESNILLKFVTLLLVLLTRFSSVVKSIFSFRDQIDGRSKVQAFYFVIMYVLLACYLVFLIPSLLTFVASFIDKSYIPASVYNLIKDSEVYANGLIASFAGFMLLTSNSKNIFSDMAIEYLGANQYLSVGTNKLLIMGKLNRLIEVISEEDKDVTIEVHAYSFGSVLAIDAIFPYTTEPSERIKKNITKLVTIGCPFNFIDIYWSNYFSDRKYTELSLTKWQNINSDLDVLSTRFDAFPVKRKAFISSDQFWEKFSAVDITYNMVNPKQVSYIQMFLFYGLKAHSNYWDKHVDAISCLLLVVDKPVSSP